MKKVFPYAVLFYLYCVSNTLFFSQTPLNDVNWNSTPYFSDEFNGSSISTSKWNFSPPWESCHQETALTTSLNTKFPYSYPISYVRVYKLKMDCNTDVTQANFNFSTFDNKVKRNITVGGAQGLMPVNTTISLRAVEVVTLNDGFEVPLGSDFFAANNDCEY